MNATNLPTCFPKPWTANGREYRWTRTYPADMRLDDTDHLAVASGAIDRYDRTPERFTHAGSTWVEDLSGVSFDDLDVAYLDYVMGTSGRVAKWVAAYANGPGDARFSDRVERGHGAGWMYATLGTFLAWQDRRASDSDLSESGFIPALDETPQDTWHEGLDWGHEATDWKPGPHEAGRLLDEIQSRRSTATYTMTKSGRADDTPIGPVTWRAMVRVTAKDGTPAFDLPGRWLPEYTKAGELTFVDRHAWDAILWAASELRELLTRVTELGADCVPESDDSLLGPVAWVETRVQDVMSRVPAASREDVRDAVRAVDRLAAQVMAEVRKVYTDPGAGKDVLEFELQGLIEEARSKFPVYRIRGIRTCGNIGEIAIDVALCGD